MPTAHAVPPDCPTLGRRLLYLDPFSGISGDMFLGALLDLGLDLALLQTELKKLALPGPPLQLSRSAVLRRGMAGVKFDLRLPSAEPPAGPGSEDRQHHDHPAGQDCSPAQPAQDHPHRHGHAHPHSAAHGHAHPHDHAAAHSHAHPPGLLETPAPGHITDQRHIHSASGAACGPDHSSPGRSSAGTCDREGSAGAPQHSHHTYADIRSLIERSGLSRRVKEQSLATFRLLAQAEGRIHGLEAEAVVFHEVGALDSIVDIVGVCIGLEALGIEELQCGPLALGGDGPLGGYLDCAHGRLPLPAPATLELVKGLPLRQSGIDKELTTPTGAALVKALATRFGALPALKVERIGYGAGDRNDPALPIPNLLRAVLGSASCGDAAMADSVIEIQANLDDSSGEELGYLCERLLAAGALEVFFTPVQMKKSRPGTLLTVLSPLELFDPLTALLFRETPSFGLRYETKRRVKLSRQSIPVETPWGRVAVKLGHWEGRLVSVHPEYEDCRRLALAHDIPLRRIVEAARAACLGFEFPP